MQAYSHFIGSRFMIRGSHPFAGYAGKFTGFRRTQQGLAIVLRVESDAEPEVYVFIPGHIREAGLEEFGKGGKR